MTKYYSSVFTFTGSVLCFFMPLGRGQEGTGLHWGHCSKRIRPPACLSCAAGAGTAQAFTALCSCQRMPAQTVELGWESLLGFPSSGPLARENRLFRYCLLEIASVRTILTPSLGGKWDIKQNPRTHQIWFFTSRGPQPVQLFSFHSPFTIVGCIHFRVFTCI